MVTDDHINNISRLCRRLAADLPLSILAGMRLSHYPVRWLAIALIGYSAYVLDPQATTMIAAVTAPLVSGALVRDWSKFGLTVGTILAFLYIASRYPNASLRAPFALWTAGLVLACASFAIRKTFEFTRETQFRNRVFVGGWSAMASLSFAFALILADALTPVVSVRNDATDAYDIGPRIFTGGFEYVPLSVIGLVALLITCTCTFSYFRKVWVNESPSDACIKTELACVVGIAAFAGYSATFWFGPIVAWPTTVVASLAAALLVDTACREAPNSYEVRKSFYRSAVMVVAAISAAAAFPVAYAAGGGRAMQDLVTLLILIPMFIGIIWLQFRAMVMTLRAMDHVASAIEHPSAALEHIRDLVESIRDRLRL